MDHSSNKIYLVEQLEDILSEWARWEYHQMMEYLNNSNSNLVITNTAITEKNPNIDEKKQNEKFWNDIIQENQQTFNKKAILIKEPVNDLVTTDKVGLKINEQIYPIKRICLLDMRAKDQLSPSDANEFDVFVFGGVLGDHPPRDRTGTLRVPGFPSRRLCDLQMSTDTALLTTQLIIEKGLELSKIPFIDEPEFIKKSGKSYEESIEMEGFSYVSNELDLKTLEIKKKAKPEPYGNPNIYKRLIFEELTGDDILYLNLIQQFRF